MPAFGKAVFGDASGSLFLGQKAIFGLADNGRSSYFLGTQWNGYSYAGDTNYVTDFTIRRGRQSGVSGSGYARTDTGSLSATLNNALNRYTFYNSGSDLYGKMLPNRKVTLTYYDTISATTYTLFTGRLSDLRPQSGGVARLEAVDGVDYFSAQNCANAALQTDYNVATAIGALLTASGYDTTSAALIDDNEDSVPVYWVDPSQTYWEALSELAQGWAGDVYIASDGRLGYQARQYSSTPVFTLADADLLPDAEIQQPWSEVRNTIRITANPRALTSAIEIWRLSDVPYVEAGASITLYARYNDSGSEAPAATVTTPASGTDYAAFANEDGSGTDYTANMSVALTQYGAEAKLVVTNTGAAAFYVTLLKLRGTLYAANSPTTATATDNTSVGDYGARALEIDNRHMQTAAEAQYHASFARLVYSQPRRVFTVKLTNSPAKQFGADLFDVITLNVSEWGVNENYRVTYIEHAYKSGQCVTTYRLEPAAETLATFWVHPGVFGTSTVLGW